MGNKTKDAGAADMALSWPPLSRELSLWFEANTGDNLAFAGADIVRLDSLERFRTVAKGSNADGSEYTFLIEQWADGRVKSVKACEDVWPVRKGG